MADPTFDPNAPSEDWEPKSPELKHTEEGLPYYQAPSKLESVSRGAKQGATFNFGDELSAIEAAGMGAPSVGSNALNFITGLGRLGYEHFGEKVGLNPGIEGRKAYEKKLEEEREANLNAKEENPLSYMGGEFAGGMLPTAGPMTNMARGATWGERSLRGAGTGAITGGLYGAGEGTDTQSRLSGAGIGSGIGGVAGGVLGPIVGPRVPQAGMLPSGGEVANALERVVGQETKLPAGVLSDSRAVHGLTQGARAVPFVGTKIDDRIHNVIEQVKERVQQEGDRLTGGVNDKAAIGAITRPAIETLVDQNNGVIDRAYSVLRGSLNQNATTHAQNTEQALNRILSLRGWKRNPNSGLEDIENLIGNPRSFDELLRARHELGMMGAWNNANPGISKGDIRALYGALTDDIESLVRGAAKNGNGNQTLRLWQNANDAAKTFINQNKVYSKLLSIKSDEGLIGAIQNAANSKTGNVSLLAQLKNSLQPDEWDNIAGLALHEMGQSHTGEFSTRFFAKNWKKMPDRVKGLLFSDPQARQFVDDVAAISGRLKTFDVFANTSNTARTAAVLSTLGVGMWFGGTDPMEHLDKVLGGTALALVLARPQTARGAAAWARAYENLVKNPTRFTLQQFQRMAGQFANQINKTMGAKVTPEQLTGREGQ